jgi:hypothetical protein
MIDFATLIERAVERDLRERFVSFLGTYKHVEFGRARPLALDETTMILTCIDTFLLNHGFFDLGVAEIRSLRGRLNRLAHSPRTGSTCITVMANTCFDALACIAALESRLSLSVARTGAIRCSTAALFPANDR